MAFSATEFIPVSAMANSDSARLFSYTTSADALAAVKAANYFDPAAAPAGGLGLKDGDVILTSASDGTSFLKVAVSAGVVTTASANDFV